MRKHRYFKCRIWFIAAIILCATGMWQLPRNFADEFIELPPLPKHGKKNAPVTLLDVDKLNKSSDKWTLDLVDPVNQFAIESAGEENPRWKINRKADGNNKTVAQLAIREGKLLFVWTKGNATDAIHRDLQQLTLRLLDSEDKELLFPMAPPPPDKVVAGHHGYDPSHRTPHEVIHEHRVPNLPKVCVLKLKIQSPFFPDLSKTGYSLRRWKKHKWDFDNADLKRLSIALQWKVERPIKKKNKQAGGERTVNVHQKITYDIGKYRDLPLNRDQIELHIDNLKKKIAENKAQWKAFNRQLAKLKTRARAIAGAKRGTREFAEQTKVRNQINNTNRRMKACIDRIESASRDIKDLNTFNNERLIGVLKQLENFPYPYQVVRVAGKREIPVVESSTWGITEDQCFPLRGEWKNNQGMRMDVSDNGITTTFGPNRLPIKHWIYKTDSVTPCSTDSDKFLLYEQTKTNIVVYSFVEKGAKGVTTTIRREFAIAENNPDVAHEKWSSATTDVWEATAKLTYLSPSGAILHEERGKRKHLKHNGTYTWHRIK